MLLLKYLLLLLKIRKICVKDRLECGLILNQMTIFRLQSICIILFRKLEQFEVITDLQMHGKDTIYYALV